MQSNVKYGISLDRKSFIVVTDRGVDVYDSIDDFLNVWRDTIEFLIKKYEDNK